MKKLLLLALTAVLAGCASEPAKPVEEAPSPAAKIEEPAAKIEEPAAKVEEPKTEEAPKMEAPKTEAPKMAPKAAAKTDAKTLPAAKMADTTPAVPVWAAKLNPGLYARFETNQGDFTAELNEKEAPGTVASFAGLADGTKEWTDPKTGKKEKKPYYDGLIFHRVIDNFMIQGGDPLGTGTGGPGFTIKDERNNLKHDKAGTLSMARTGAPDSAGSQFYVTVTATTFLDGQNPPYVVFGQVIDGVEIPIKIGKVRTVSDRPVDPVTIKKIRTLRVK